MTFKHCTKCQSTKSVEEFDRNRQRADRLQVYCRSCMASYAPRYREARERYRQENREAIRERNRQRYANNPRRWLETSRRRKYGLTAAEVEAMLEAQTFQCAICLEPLPDSTIANVDHCHTTGVVRGLLCQRCNHLLGHAHDDVTNLASAVGYLVHGAGSFRGISIEIEPTENAGPPRWFGPPSPRRTSSAADSQLDVLDDDPKQPDTNENDDDNGIWRLW